MGRKPLASMAEERAPSSDGGNSPLTGEALRVELTELLPELPKMLFENGNAVSNGMEPSYSVANPAKFIIGSQTKRKYKSTTDSSKVKAKKPKAPVRRSGRLQNVIMPARNKDIGPAIEDLTARDGEEVVPRVCEETRLPELSLTEKNTEEKVLSLTKDVEILKSCFEALKSKFETMEETWSGRTPGSETRTGSLHEECQQKIEALTNENRELAKKLDNANMMYSKGNCLFGELLEKVKDIMLLFGLKAADMVPLAPDATESILGRGFVNGMN